MSTSDSGAPVAALRTRVFVIPTDTPESDATLAWNSTTLVWVEVDAGGSTGVGFTYADRSVAVLIDGKLSGAIEGLDALDIPACRRAMTGVMRNLGRPGISSMALSAVDIALWDLKAKLLDLSLVKLLGAARPVVAAYGSGGFTSYSPDQLRKQLSDWAEHGFASVKIKIARQPQADPQRIEVARKAIGDAVELFVDANGGYERKQALHWAHYCRDRGVSWFEEPVSSDDLEGLRLLRDRAPGGLRVTAGEYGYHGVYFRHMLQAGAVDVLQADATRCGGISGLLEVAALCQAFQIPLSTHTAPGIHLHAACALQPVESLEWFHDHARIEQLLFDGAPQIRDGQLRPDLQRPGLGLSLKTQVAQRYVQH